MPIYKGMKYRRGYSYVIFEQDVHPGHFSGIAVVCDLLGITQQCSCWYHCSGIYKRKIRIWENLVNINQ